jgi:hypothetical protein
MRKGKSFCWRFLARELCQPIRTTDQLSGIFGVCRANHHKLPRLANTHPIFDAVFHMIRLAL